MDEILSLLAAQLGEEWAILNYPENFLEPDMTTIIDDQYAWQKVGEKLKEPRSPERLRVTLDFILEVEDAGLELNWNRLVETVCWFEPSHEGNRCEFIIAQLNEEQDIVLDNNFARALDKIEQNAIQMGLYYYDDK